MTEHAPTGQHLEAGVQRATCASCAAQLVFASYGAASRWYVVDGGESSHACETHATAPFVPSHVLDASDLEAGMILPCPYSSDPAHTWELVSVDHASNSVEILWHGGGNDGATTCGSIVAKGEREESALMGALERHNMRVEHLAYMAEMATDGSSAPISDHISEVARDDDPVGDPYSVGADVVWACATWRPTGALSSVYGERHAPSSEAYDRLSRVGWYIGTFDAWGARRADVGAAA